MTDATTLETPFPRPLSEAKVSELPTGLIPARTALTGRYATLEPMNAAQHSAALYHAGHENEEALKIWDYLAYGPWDSEESYRTVLRQQSASFDPIFATCAPLDIYYYIYIGRIQWVVRDVDDGWLQSIWVTK